jgi:hypothetical protein
LGSFADAYGFTPTDVFRLTLPQIAAYGRYAEAKSAALDGDAPSSPSKPEAGKVSSVDELVAMFGDPESKRALLDRQLGGVGDGPR